MSMTSLVDFRGGYATEVSDELMTDSMVRKLRNLYYNSGMRMRPGVKTAYASAGTVGAKRVNLGGGWITLIAAFVTGTVRFYTESSGTLTQIDSGFTWTQGSATYVSIDSLGSEAVLADGINYPAVVKYDGSSYSIQYVDSYATLTRTNDDWYAGQYDVSETIPYIDETTQAQDDATTSFDIATATNGDGFYVSGILTFNKVVVTDFPQFDGSPVAVYEYYAGAGTWTTFTPTTSPNLTAAAGTKTLEFDIPFDSDGNILWVQYGDLTSQVDPTDQIGGLLGRYVIRVRFTTAPTSAQQSGMFTLYHTQYLRQIMANEKPSLVSVNLDRFYLASGNTVQISDFSTAKTWQDYNVEYLQEGGDKILAMVPTSQYLACFKSGVVYSITGNSFDNRVVNVQNRIGTISGLSVACDNDRIFFAAKDGVYVIVNDTALRVTKHINSDIPADTEMAASVGCFYNGYYYFSTSSLKIMCDPDTLKLDDSGDGLVSWSNWYGFTVGLWIPSGNRSDTSNLRFYNGGTVYEFDPTQRYDGSVGSKTAIDWEIDTKYFSFTTPQRKKAFQRLKTQTTKSGIISLTLASNDGELTKSTSYDSGSGSGVCSKFLSIPGVLDGRNLQVRLSGSMKVDFQLYGFTIEYQQRVN